MKCSSVDFAERMRKVVKMAGSNRKLAKELDCSLGAISGWISGDTEPTRRFIALICEKFNLNPDWLVTGSGDILKEGKKFIDKEAVEIAVGLFNNECEFERQHYGQMPVEFLKNLTQSEKPKVIFIDNDTMEVSLKKGSMVLIDHEERYTNEGIYLLKINDELVWKRIVCLPNGKLLLMCDNPKYPTKIDVDISDLGQDIKVIGKALAGLDFIPV